MSLDTLNPPQATSRTLSALPPFEPASSLDEQHLARQLAIGSTATLPKPVPLPVSNTGDLKPGHIPWIDVCKGLSMIGIVASHNGPLMERLPLLHDLLFSFLVPLFFFTSGLTLRVAPKRPQALERAAALLGSYIVLSLVVVPYTLFKEPSAQWSSVLAGIVYGTGHTIALTPFWFIPCLAVSLLINHLLLRELLPRLGVSPSRTLLAGLGLALALGGGHAVNTFPHDYQYTLGWGSVAQSGMIWSLDLVPIALGFLLIGQATSADRLLRTIQKYPAGAFGLLTVLVGLCVGVLVGAWTPLRIDVHTDLHLRAFTPTALAFAMAVCGGTAMVIFSTFVSFVPPLCRLFTSFGQAGLVILWLHNALQNSIAHKLLSSAELPPLAFALIALFVSIAIPYLLDRLVIQRFAPLKRLVYPRFSFSAARAAS